MSGCVRTACVITVSDRRAAGIEPDQVGPALVQRLAELPLTVGAPEMVADDARALRSMLTDVIGRNALVVLTGGTGISVRDTTPEVVEAVCERMIPGMAEAMRHAGMQNTPHAMLSRQVAGIAGSTLILAVPGSPHGALESLNAVWGALPHAMDLLAGRTAHPGTMPA